MFRKKPKKSYKVAVKKDVFSTSCDKHKIEHPIEMFCENCGKLCCVVCQGTNHNGDNHKIVEIEEAAYDCARTVEFNRYDEELDTLRMLPEKTLAKNIKIQENTKQLKDKAKELLEIQRKFLIDWIEIHYKTLDEEIERRFKKSETRLDKLKEQLKKKTSVTYDIWEEINEKKNGDDVTLFIAMKKSQAEIKEINQKLDEIQDSNFLDSYYFQPGQFLQKAITKKQEFGGLFDTPMTSPEEFNRNCNAEVSGQANEETEYLVPASVYKVEAHYFEEDPYTDHLEQDRNMEPAEMMTQRDNPSDYSLHDQPRKSAPPPIVKKTSPRTIRQRRVETVPPIYCQEMEQDPNTRQTQKPEI